MKVYIVYEVYNREYDNCLLLRSALEKRGFDAQIVYKMDLLSIKPSIERRILIIPNCYNTDNFNYYYYASGCGNSIIINMQYEQVLSTDERNIEKHCPRGKASQLYNLCWGENFKEFLTKAGIGDDKCILGGALQLDFLKPSFNNYWIERSELLKKYGIDSNLEITLFISSFAYADNEFVNRASDKVYGKDNNADFRVLSHDSREGILDWFESFLKNNTSKVLIYRKHPMEKYNERLLKLREKYRNNLYLIDDYNIKQWIVISDRVLNWYSTSAVECVVSGKPFEILRPINVDSNTEVVLFKGATFINNYESFIRIMNSDCKEERYPFDTKLINKMYLIDKDMAFARIVSWIEAKISSELDLSYIDSSYRKNRAKYIYSNHLAIKFWIKKAYQLLFRSIHIKIRNEKLLTRFAVEDWEFQALLKDDKDKISIIENNVARYYRGKGDINNV